MEIIDWTNVNILVVEDSPTQALSLKSQLEEIGANVDVATHGKEALEMIGKTLPTVIVSDIEMPIMNGYELCNEIKKNKNLKYIPIVLLTNLNDPMDVIHGIQSGADNFLTKPCPIDLLISCISDALENMKLEKGEEDEHTLEFTFSGKKHQIQASQLQITDLLLSTYSSAMQKNSELEESNRKLSRLHLELQKKSEELYRINEEKNKLLGMAAHDLRNPLSVIQGYSSLLLAHLEGKMDEKYQKMISNIKSTSTLMLHIVNDLLDISAIDSGKVSLNKSLQDIVPIIAHNVSLNQSLADNKNIKILFNQKENISPISCDVSKVEQILNNLINNAIKYSNSDTTIDVDVFSVEDGIQIDVKDQGVGIPTDDHEKIFSSFTKSKNNTTAGEPSTGLGLAIVKKIIDEHQGKIWFDSQEGQGSTFHVVLKQ